MKREPYADPHEESLRRKAQPPKNLLGWFMEQYRAEMPAKVHGDDVWRDRVSSSEAKAGIRPVGGSLLGSPRTNDTFRRYIEDSPFTVEVAEYEGHKDPWPHYSFPLRAALATLGGRGRDSDTYPFMARHLYKTALCDGDWDAACVDIVALRRDETDAIVVDEEASTNVRRLYIEEALRRLWGKFSVEPPARTVRTTEAA